jgi:hypothetical protein
MIKLAEVVVTSRWRQRDLFNTTATSEELRRESRV